MKVLVDYDICASTGACTQVCPEVFEVRSDGYLYVLIESPGEESVSYTHLRAHETHH
jgi:ferredoxin